jgi:hypothetical protein
MVLIKDFEMPKNCGKCPAFAESDYGDWCRASYTNIYDADNRDKGCPLREVPTSFEIDEDFTVPTAGKPLKYHNIRTMNLKEIIDGLKFTKAMYEFDPGTGEEIKWHMMNDLDLATYNAVCGALKVLSNLEEEKNDS